MKKLLLLFPLIVLNCNKKEVANSSTELDSSQIHERDTSKVTVDSTDNGIISPENDQENEPNNAQNFRTIEGHKIIKTINADMLPMTLEDELTTEHQQLVIKIKNFKASKIAGSVHSLKPGLNIRFNQIKLPNGDYDGPFGQKFTYDIKEKGEIWLVLGKNNMETAETTGKFMVELQ